MILIAHCQTIIFSPCVQTGETALYYAVQSGHEQVVEVLLNVKANVNHQRQVR